MPEETEPTRKGLTNKPIKQHYVPQTYLEGFAKMKGNKFYLNIFDKENGKIFSSDTSAIGMENYFYSKEIAQEIETIFCHFEGLFKTALKKLIEHKDLNQLTYIDKKIISDFIAIQFLRTNETRLIYKEMSDGLINIVGKHNIPNFVEGSVTLSEDSLKRLHLGAVLKSFPEISDIMFKEMSWKLCVNYTNTPFWTSDNPCAIYNELEPEPFRGNLGLRCKGVQLHFPVSDKLLLILVNPDVKLCDLSRAKSLKKERFRIEALANSPYSDLNIIDLLPDKESVKEERVTFENNLQVIYSTRFIFSKFNDFKLAEKYLEEYPHYKSKNRQRMIIN